MYTLDYCVEGTSAMEHLPLEHFRAGAKQGANDFVWPSKIGTTVENIRKIERMP